MAATGCKQGMSTGMQLRLGRLFDRESGTTVMIALSNAMYYGPAPGLNNNEDVRKVVTAVVEGGSDAIMITPGALRAHVDLLSGRDRPAIVLSAAYTNAWRAKDRFGNGGRATEQALFLSVDEAARLGADAYHVYAFMGWNDAGVEAREIERIGMVCERAHALGMPVLCEPLARGDAVEEGAFNSPANVALMARTAAEIGVDIVKVEYTGDAESFGAVVQASYVPVVMMGGAQAPDFDGFLETVGSAVRAGARGLAVGRNIYSQTDAAGAIKRVLHAVRSNSGKGG
jgi:DhnA family fructose-bisphosphate aldolase class Ia